MKKRRDILEIILEIIKLLHGEQELSIKQISGKTYARWETTRRALTFLKELNIVKERSSQEGNARLFSLK